MNYAKDINGDVIAYEGTMETDSWNAYMIPAEDYDGDLSSLPNFDDPGMPWEPTAEQLQQEAEAVVLQHMVKEKVAELRWDSSTQYHVGDVVYHNGAMWRATSNNSNNEPDDVPGDWEQVS